jgi:hypothetical protein
MGCFLTCGMQTCSARETCDPITLMCVRGLDAGSTRLDAGSADTGVSTQDSGAAPDTGAPGTDAPSPALDAFASTEDAFSGGTTCSLGLPTSGTRAVMGDVSGFALNTFVVAGEGRVVWAGTSGIQVSDAAMSPPVGIARSEVQDLAITPTHLYWSEGALSAGSLYRLAWSELTTGVPERVATDPLPIYQIAVSSTALYWTTATGAAVTIRRAALDGSMSLELGADTLRAGERGLDLVVAGDQAYLSKRAMSGATGCFRVLRADAGMPAVGLPLPPPVAAYGLTAGTCSATSHGRFGVEGGHVFFHSAAPPEVVDYSPSTGVRTVATGFGDGSDIGVTPTCLVAGARGLLGNPRGGGTWQAYTMGDATGNLAVDGPYAYALVPRGAAGFTVVRIGL